MAKHYGFQAELKGMHMHQSEGRESSPREPGSCEMLWERVFFSMRMLVSKRADAGTAAFDLVQTGFAVKLFALV